MEEIVRRKRLIMHEGPEVKSADYFSVSACGFSYTDRQRDEVRDRECVREEETGR